MHEVRREMSDAWAYGRATSRFRKKITKLMVTFIFEDFKGSVGVVGQSSEGISGYREFGGMQKTTYSSAPKFFHEYLSRRP